MSSSFSTSQSARASVSRTGGVLALCLTAIAVLLFAFTSSAGAASKTAAHHAAPTGHHKRCGKHRVLRRRHGHLRCVPKHRRPKPAPAPKPTVRPQPSAPHAPAAPSPTNAPGPIGQPPVPPLPTGSNSGSGAVAHTATAYVFEGCQGPYFDTDYDVYWSSCDWATSDATILTGYYYWSTTGWAFWFSTESYV